MKNTLTPNLLSTYIKVSAIPVFIEQESSHSDGRYIWSYQIKIENSSDSTVQLHSRYWKITDSFGRCHEVRGQGVIGEQPILQPGDVFEYTSATSLTSPSGIMEGFYDMKDDEGQAFKVQIPVFSLDSPYEKRTLN
ncbi:MAG: Co2+/Mg2+ efflux protein ApaG [Janthinobacterium lividum]